MIGRQSCGALVDTAAPPVVIGALGGSGTRVVARIVAAAGYFLGGNRNVSEDAMEFVEFYDRWINRYVLRHQAPLCGEEDTLMARDFLDSVARHRRDIPAAEAPWGWKEPRSLYLLPFFHAHFPGLKFIHVIRDGRDMAFSANQNQLRKHGGAVLGPALDDAPQPVRTAALWTRVNLDAAAYGESRLGGNYLQVQFEALCRDPRRSIQALETFLGGTVDAARALDVVVPPPSLGRWRTRGDEALLAAIHAQAGEALRRFDYADGVPAA
jgi:Sulfotransferase family